MAALLIVALPYITPLLVSAGLGAVIPFLSPTSIKMAFTAIKVLSSAKLPPLSNQEKEYIRSYRATRSTSDMARGW